MSRDRDEEFRAFVLARRADLVRTAVLLTAGDPHLAEDLTQTTLTALYVNWPAYRRAANPAAYARRCLVNALIDEKRRPWRRERPTDEFRDGGPGPVAAAPEGTDGGRVEALYQALRELPPRMRAVLVFRYFHDLTVAETADALSCSQGTVKSQANRALDKLRERMAGPVTAPAPHPYRTCGAFGV
jgi:RNA polymerase sigma-70 factor (sigma-E family)